ncbi:MAG: glycosyltransferase family 4 protein [Candidatus Borkfalkiaceae bacterium]|nr:glycosyltransferase family 4 protein [Clostridia bacterium]MDY6222696.1 glycosyltransferase family 4 protein [Christensenellaceae bacterium]
MKLAFYINTLSGGGAERVVANLANFLSQDNETIVINSFKTENEYPLNNLIKHIYLDNNDYSSRLKKNVYRIKNLRKILKKEKVDVLISFMAEPNFRSCLACIGLKTKLIVSVRNDPTKEYSGILGKITGKVLMPTADGCVFQTEDAKRWFPKKLQKKSTIIYNAVNKTFFSSEYNGERRNIVTCGRLTEQKNHKLLIDSFNMIKEDCSDNLLIYGDGPLKDKLKNYLSDLKLNDRIFLMGRTENVITSIKDARIFVLSSNYEGMPNALMEAMALGIPCISTDCPCGGPRMIINNKENGLLVNCNNVDDLSSALKLLLADENLSKTIGKNAREAATRMFASDKIDLQWKNYIEGVFYE